MHKHGLNHTSKTLEEIWNQVPPDYYQNGVENNILQRAWHTRKLYQVKTAITIYNKKPLKILDVGSSSGWFLSEISKSFPSAKCYGIDVYEDAIKYGSKQYKNLKLTCADAHKIPFRNETFDVIICTEVLEHVEDPQNVLNEIKRVLTSDGIAIIEMDSGNWLFKLIWHFWTNVRNGAWKDSHIHAFETKKLENLIKKAGFKIINKNVFNYSMAVIFTVKKSKSN